MVDATAFAEREYGKFKAIQKQIRHEEADRAIAEVKAAQKALSGRKG